MTVLFFRRDAAEARKAPALGEDIEVRTWRPDQDGAPPAGSRRPSNLAWLAFSRLGLFAGPGFEELTLWRGGRLVHRLIVTPRWRRFPFMAEGDLQIGDVWTEPGVRGRGLARAGLTLAHQRLAARCRRVWYLTDQANAASVRLAESGGYTLVGEGRRTRPLGLSAAGRYLLEVSGEQC